MVIERVVAIVDDKIILESEVMLRLRPLLGELQKVENEREREKQLRSLRNQALDEMVAEELLMHAAAEAKLEVEEPEINKAMEQVKLQNKVTDEQLKEALAQQGYTVEQYRADVKKQILRLRAINVFVRPRVNVTDDKLRKAYEKMIGKAATVTEVKVRHVLIRLPEKPSDDATNTARRRAGELVARARAGEDFSELAAKNSDDAATKTQGGDLGTFKRGELPTEWEEILFAMSEGEVRGPIRGPQGLHVFQVVSAKKEEVRAFEEVKEQLRNQLFNEEMEKQTQLWLDELKKKAHVEIKL